LPTEPRSHRKLLDLLDKEKIVSTIISGSFVEKSKVTKSNIVLVGMPGAGKSTVGIVLAKAISKDFADTDVLIQNTDGRSLQRILDENGYLALRKIEEGILLGLNFRNTVIATGGSAVYSNAPSEIYRGCHFFTGRHRPVATPN
jgi:hypothetical protein